MPPEPPAAPAKVTAAAAPPPVRPQLAPANTVMSGAAPVVPAGTFDSRWSAFR
jgi:hypothetical protein